MRQVPCCLCGAQAYELLFHACDRVYGVPGIFSVVQCVQCGLCRTLPQPDPDDLARYYPEDAYYAYVQRRPESARRTGRRMLRVLRHLPAPLLPLAFRAIAKRRPGRVLDVGCGSGAFLDDCAALGWATVGVDTSPRAVELTRAAGHEAHCGDFATVQLPGAPFDLIRLFHVLEHMHDPLAGLRRARELLAEHGILLIGVPDIEAPWARWMAQDWYGLEVPRHLWHFSRRTLLRALGVCGLRATRVRTHSACPIWSLTHRRARLRARKLEPTVFQAPAAWKRLVWQVGTAPPRLVWDLFRLGDDLVVEAAP